MDEDVEAEVEGSSKWTDRALMLQYGLLTAVQVEEHEADGFLIQRIRARYGPKTWAPWRKTGDQYSNPLPPRILQLEGRRQWVSGYSGKSFGSLRSIVMRSLDGKEERAGLHMGNTFNTLREFDGSTMTPTHLSGNEKEKNWSVCFNYQ